MGYQESVIYTKINDVKKNNEEVAKILEIFKKYDVRCNGDSLAECVVKLNLKKNIGKYKKGMDLLIISGERQAQRNQYRIFDIYHESTDREYTDREWKIIESVKIDFIEEAMCLIEAEKDLDAIESMRLNLIPGLPGNYKEISRFINEAQSNVFNYGKKINSNIEHLYQYKISSQHELDDCLEILENTAKGHGLEFKVVKEKAIVDENLVRYDYNLFINGIEFSKISELTWSNNYTFDLFMMEGQNLRNMCSKLLEKQ